MNRDLSPGVSQRSAALLGWCGFAGLVAIYILFHYALRVALSPTIGVDDVAEAIFAQGFQWGYYPRQPPLYTWLLWTSFGLLGVNVAAVAFLKYAFVAAGYVFYFLAARRIFTDRRLAFLAGLSPSLIYAVGYGVHVGFTNTVLLTAACAATFYVLLRVIQDGRTGDYIALGFALGIGLLAKWGYPAFAGVLIAAALMQDGPRRRLRDPRILLTLAVALALIVPYLAFGFAGGRAMHNLFTGAMREGGHAPYFAGVWAGLKTLTVAVTMFLAPFWIFAIAVFPRALTAPRANAGAFDVRRLFEHFFAIMVLVLLAGVFVVGVTFFKSRWMHPVLILFPLYFFCLVQDAGFTPRQVKLWIAALAAVAVGVVAVLLAQDVIGAPYCGKCRLLKPYPELARAIAQQGFSGGTIIAGDEHIAGNFRLAFPQARVATAKYDFYVPPAPATDSAGRCLVVWDASEGDAVPPALAKFLDTSFEANVPSSSVRQSVAAPYRHGVTQMLSLDFVVLPGAGRCR